MPYMHKRTFDITYSMGMISDGTTIHYNPKPDFFEVDELIAIPLQILNRKGYLTGCSCAGHPSNHVFFIRTNDEAWEPYSDNSFCEYISYITFLKDYDFPTLPEGFEKNKTAKGIRIFKKYEKDEDAWKIQCSICDAMKNLHDWALELPNLCNSGD